MLLLQTVITLMTGFICPPAANPAAELAVSALTGLEPPIVCSSGETKKVKKVIVRSGDCADGEKQGECKGTCKVVVKRVGANGDKPDCCDSPEMICKMIGSFCGKGVRADDGTCKIIVRRGSAGGDGPAECGSMKKKIRINCDGDKPGCCDSPEMIYKMIGSFCGKGVRADDGTCKIIVRRGSAGGDGPAECGSMKKKIRINCDGDKPGCCDSPEMIHKMIGSFCGKGVRADDGTCKIIVRRGSAGGDGPGECGSMKKKIRINCDGDKPGCCDSPRIIRRQMGSAGRDGPSGRGLVNEKFAIAFDGDEAGAAADSFFINLDDEDDGPGVAAFTLDSEDEEPVPGAKAFCIRLDDKDVGSGVAQGGPGPGGPWLGVQFGPVSKPLAAQLNLGKGVGQMILNVIEDSPADKAGLQQYDVIIQIDGKDASAEIENFMGVVKEFAPGEKHRLLLIRGGRQAEATLEVGVRPEEISAAKYKYDTELEELAQSDVLQRGGVLRRGPDGQWTFEGLDDLKHMPDEQGLKYLFDMAGGGAGCKVMVRTGKDETLEIRCEEGKITVTRTAMDGAGGEKKTTTKTYANEEEMKKEDPDAYKMMKECGGGGKCVLKNKDQNILITPRGDHVKIVPKELEKELQELQQNAKDVRKSAAEAQAQAEKAFAEAMSKHGDGATAEFFSQQKARISFDVATDGTIRVTTRKGSEELTQAFRNADELKKVRPDLYEKYQKLHEGGRARSQE